jgi:hypothetical protein
VSRTVCWAVAGRDSGLPPENHVITTASRTPANTTPSTAAASFQPPGSSTWESWRRRSIAGRLACAAPALAVLRRAVLRRAVLGRAVLGHGVLGSGVLDFGGAGVF